MNFLGSEHDDLVEEADRDLVEEGEVWEQVEVEAPGAFRPRLR